VDDFVKQLDYFGNVFGFTNKEDFQESISSAKPSTGVVLTFDDGFKDHYHYVLPKLLEYGLWGIFYIPISPLLTDKLIDVHRIHQLIGKHGGKTIADALQGILTKDMLSHERVKEFQSETYKKQNNDSSTNYVKRALNYFIDYRYRENVIEQLMSDFYPNESDLTHNFYMTSAELEHMHNSGMVLGSHTVNHPVMSKISIDDQKREIMQSFDMIESITGEIALKTFCYPYGGFHTFTSQTERLLEENGCLFSFNVESRDINQEDLINRRQALPRFNCNEFPYGSRR
jgi:peptidoglycan/xylan/chitin deacetylase (PgdA/CDA1 family)